MDGWRGTRERKPISAWEELLGEGGGGTISHCMWEDEGRGRGRENNACGEERKCLEYVWKEGIEGLGKTLQRTEKVWK